MPQIIANSIKCIKTAFTDNKLFIPMRAIQLVYFTTCFFDLMALVLSACARIYTYIFYLSTTAEISIEVVVALR